MNLGVFVWNSVWLVLFWKLNYIYPNCKNYKKSLFAYISGKILEMPNFSSQDFETVDWKHRQMCLVNLAATIVSMVAKALETSAGRRKRKGSGHLVLSVMESWLRTEVEKARQSCHHGQGGEVHGLHSIWAAFIVILHLNCAKSLI